MTSKVIDIDFKDRNDKWVLSFRDSVGTNYETRLGKLHNNVRQRGKVGGAYQRHWPTYKGVTIADDFIDAQDFCNWAVAQKGWGSDVVLDKDLLIAGNKVYAPDRCVFIPEHINIAISSHKTARASSTPIGVHKSSKDCYIARCGTRKEKGKYRVNYLGAFKTAAQAHQAYCEFKEGYVHSLAIQHKTDLDVRAYNALMKWRVMTLH